MFYCPENGTTVQNAPEPAASFSLFIEKTHAWGTGIKQTFTHFSTGRTHQRVIGYDASGAKGSWTPIATATPPEEIPLNLAAGWQIKNYAKFWKNQFGEVSLFFRVGKATGETAQGTIATLPAGFRPAVPVHAAAVTYPGLHPALLVIGSDGTVMVFCNNVESSAEGSFCGSAAFVAAM